MLRRLLIIFLILECFQPTQCGEGRGKEDSNLEIIKKMSDVRFMFSLKTDGPVPILPIPVECSLGQKTSSDKFVESYSNTNHPLSIPEMNGDMAGMLIEGDIVPSERDIAAMEERLRLEDDQLSGKQRGHRDRRGAPVTNVKLWDKTKPIPYILGEDFNEQAKIFIRKAIMSFHENTCLTFEENGPGKKLEYLFSGDDGPCNSIIGDDRDSVYNPESQKINLGTTCFNWATVQHETMHALGFDHTQTRVSGGFEIDKTKPSIVPKDLDYVNSLAGGRATFNDWKMINLHYNCNDRCPTKIVCHNGGYQNSHICEQCVCPQFHTGPYCEQELDVLHLAIGESITKDYAQPFNHTTYWNASIWDDYATYKTTTPQIVKAPEGTHIRVTINNISDSVKPDGICLAYCNVRALEIVEDDFTLVGKRFCCNPHRADVDTLPYTFLSKKNKIGYLFYSAYGIDFTANVTFSVEETPVLPPTEPPTPNNPDEPSATEDTIDSQTENPHSDESDTEEYETNEPSEHSQNSDTERAKRQAIVSEDLQTTHSETRAGRTELTSTVGPKGNKQATSNASAEKNVLLDALGSLESLLFAVSEKFSSLVDYIHC